MVEGERQEGRKGEMGGAELCGVFQAECSV